MCSAELPKGACSSGTLKNDVPTAIFTMKNGLERGRDGATPTNQRTGGSSTWDAPVASCSHTRMRGSPVYGDVGVLQPRQICLARSPLLSQTTHAAPPKAVPPRQLAAAPPSRAATKSSTSPAHVASAVAVGSKWLSAPPAGANHWPKAASQE